MKKISITTLGLAALVLAGSTNVTASTPPAIVNYDGSAPQYDTYCPSRIDPNRCCAKATADFCGNLANQTDAIGYSKGCGDGNGATCRQALYNAQVAQQSAQAAQQSTQVAQNAVAANANAELSEQVGDEATPALRAVYNMIQEEDKAKSTK